MQRQAALHAIRIPNVNLHGALSCVQICEEWHPACMLFKTDKYFHFKFHLPSVSLFNATLKGQCLEIFCLWFFSWISFPPAPQPPSILLGPFRIFSKVRRDIRRSWYTTGINDTNGKFATGVNNTGGKISTGVNDTSGKHATGVVDTGGVPWPANFSTSFASVVDTSMILAANCHRYQWHRRQKARSRKSRGTVPFVKC